jgi:hypothetical protein
MHGHPESHDGACALVPETNHHAHHNCKHKQIILATASNKSSQAPVLTSMNHSIDKALDSEKETQQPGPWSERYGNTEQGAQREKKAKEELVAGNQVFGTEGS